MFIYLASSPSLLTQQVVKIGCTQDPHKRRSTYLTGCPPGLTPSHDIDYMAIWKTTATSRDEMFDCEEEVHDHFLLFRMMREKPFDSEWFHFKSGIALDEVRKFIESRPWFAGDVALTDVIRPPTESRYLRRQYHKNLDFIKSHDARNAALDLIQAPVIASIAAFVADPSNSAGYVIAPCGSGKTRMTSQGLHGIKRCVICCPSNEIQHHWKRALLLAVAFSADQIHIIGGSGTTDTDDIRELCLRDTVCMITTYASSHLLVDLITSQLELLVLDEAHHMAGIVARDETGEGRTRRLMLKASDVGIKRLSLTYTPRFITDSVDPTAEYLTMDDSKIFGKQIAELNIRDLIKKGVLPDYRLWMLRDEGRKGTGIIGKAECLLEAWMATEIVRRKEKFTLHHLIVFTATLQEAREMDAFFKAKTTDTLVLRVEAGDRLDTVIAEFTAAPRAILINCLVLNEGVDIPAANAVAITYPKHSRGQITQMILRAGRWYEGKSLFHILIPTLGDEDLSGFENVLTALASCDAQLSDEIILRASKPAAASSSAGDVDTIIGDLPERIMIEEFEADVEKLKRCFANVRKGLFHTKDSRRIQMLCMERGVDTSVGFATLRAEIPELPEDPRPRGVLWYDYLHPDAPYESRIPIKKLGDEIIKPHSLLTAAQYDTWRDHHPELAIPSTQHILDGYYVADSIDSYAKLTITVGAVSGRGRGR